METLTPAMTPAQETRHPHTTSLRRGTLSAGFITLLVISAASPLSVVAGGFPIGMMLGNGAGTPVLVLVALGLLLMFATGYTAMATCVTSAGGFYAMVARGLGGRAGGAAAMVAVFGYVTLQFGLYGLLGAVASEALQAQFGLAVSWWACAFAAMASVAVFGYRQIDFSARVLAVFVVAEYLAVLALDVLILSKGGAHGIDAHSFSPEAFTSGNPFIGLLFCFAAFIGFEATTIYSEEAKDPKRSIPFATYAALLLVGGFYSFSLWCLVLGAGSDRVVAAITALADPTNLLYLLSDTYAGHGLTMLLRIMFIASIYAGLIAFHNSSARYFYAMGREGLMPARLGWTHARHRSPYVASVLQTVLSAVAVGLFALLGADPVLTQFAWLSNLATLCLLVLMIATAVAVVRFFRAESHGYGRLRIRVLPLLACAGLLVVLVLAVGNFHVLTGASRGISVALVITVPLAAAAGWLAASRLARRDPQRFAALGQDRS
ncbi:APC family permease [Variovorax atrisoli]|uniref:APC family permease n=1 Tax=Variovorax atrisoli TaxID=3394203 RepID=UPI0040402B36